MDLERQLQNFQQKYIDLEQQAAEGSLERHVYNQIVQSMMTRKDTQPPKQRAFETQISLVAIAKVLDPPGERHVVWDAVKELEQLAGLHPLR